MRKTVAYTPKPGWFNLSILNLPKNKFKAYAELQELGQRYQAEYKYHKKYNNSQLQKLKELCAEMSLDLILNYGALEIEREGRHELG